MNKKSILILFFIIIIALIVAVVFTLNYNKQEIDYSIFNNDGIILYSCNTGGYTTEEYLHNIYGEYVDLEGNVYKYFIPAKKYIVTFDENGNRQEREASSDEETGIAFYRSAVSTNEIDNNILKEYTTKKVTNIPQEDMKKILYNASKVSDEYMPVEIHITDVGSISVYLNLAEEKKTLVDGLKMNTSLAGQNIIDIVKENRMVQYLEYYEAQKSNDVILFTLSYATYGKKEWFEYVKGRFIDMTGNIYTYQIPRDLLNGYSVDKNKITSEMLKKYQLEKIGELNNTALSILKSIRYVPDEYKDSSIGAIEDIPENFIIAFVDGKQKLIEANYKVNNAEQWEYIRNVLVENNFLKARKDI